MSELLHPFLHDVARRGGIVSGGPVPDDFERGWGKHPFCGEKAHHWTAIRTVQMEGVLFGLDSACGIDTIATPQVRLLEPGTWEYCRRCEQKLMKAMR